MMARQLVDAVQEWCHAHTRAGCKHVSLQMGAQCVGRVALERARRNRIAGPREHRRGDQQCFIWHAFVLYDKGFAVRFCHVGERAVGIRVILLQMIERGVQRGLVGVADDLGQQRIKLGLPEAVFGATARRE